MCYYVLANFVCGNTTFQKTIQSKCAWSLEITDFCAASKKMENQLFKIKDVMYAC